MATHPAPNTHTRPLSPENDRLYGLRVFSADRFPPSPAAVLSLTDRATPPDSDVAVARFERALRVTLPGHREGRGIWPAPAEPLLRGIRLCLAEEEVDEVLPDIEALARRFGLAILDERLGDVSFPTRVSAREEVLRAASALVAAGDGYLAVEGGPRDLYYVQAFACRAEGQVTLEAVGNPCLPAELRLSRAQLTALRRQGWRRHGGPQGNYQRVVGVAAPEEAAATMAALICDTLTGIYALEPASPICICLALG